MKFDLETYKDDSYIAMHCPRNDDAKVFLKFLRDHGKTWCHGIKYNLAQTRHGEYKERTVYYFNRGTHGSLGHARRMGRTVLSFEDFYWGSGKDPNELEISDEDESLFNSFMSQFLNKTTVS